MYLLVPKPGSGLDGLPTLQREFDAGAIDLLGETALLEVLIGDSVGGLRATRAVRCRLRPLPPIVPSYSNAADRQRRPAAPVTISASRRAPAPSGRLLATAVARTCQSGPHSLSSQLCASQAMPLMRSG